MGKEKRMKTGDVISEIKHEGFAPEVVKKWLKKSVQKSRGVKTFQELENSFKQEEVILTGMLNAKVRVSTSWTLQVCGIQLLIIRDDSMFLGNTNDQVVNLKLADVIVASRVEIPGGNAYGILGKIDNLRGKTEEYYELNISASIDDEMMAYEFNSKSGESCFMSRGTIVSNSQWLLEKLLEDPKVIACTAKI